MTVPMSPNCPNVIVGENLFDFLNLGCRYGYFALEQLAYERDEIIEELGLKRFDPDTWPERQQALDELIAHFGLKPWDDPGKRLDQLRDRYLYLLAFQPQ
jgi:hypothetical protein